MMTRALLFLWLSLSLQGDEKARAGLRQTQESNPQDEFFSGTVQELSETSVSVSRTLPGKSAETRVFSVDSETVIEGKLKKQVRVTVGYRTRDGQEHAWRIIVRESPE